MKLDNIKIGCDPELFIWDTNTDTPYPSVGLIGGTKSKPKFFSGKHMVQEDNVLAEFGIPATNKVEEFIGSINLCKEFIQSLLPKGFTIRVQASAYFDKNYLQTDQAKEFGCDPDFSAWTESVNEKPDSDTNLRTSGKIVCHLN